MLLDCGKVSCESTVEFVFYIQDGDGADKPPVGALWLPDIDIINYNINDSGSPQQHSSTKIDSWFAMAPAGRVHLMIGFGKTHLKNEHRNCLTHPISAELPFQESEVSSHPSLIHNDYSETGHTFVVKKFPHQILCAIATSTAFHFQ